MEHFDNMEKIEAAQTEIGQFLVSMMPVPWKKICFYADCAPGYAETWFAMIEKETDVICMADFFWDRYDNCPVKRMDVFKRLAKLALSLYNAYLERFGEEKIWRSMFYTLDSDGAIHIDFIFEKLPGSSLDQRYAVYERFFHTEYRYYKGKYSSTEFIIPKRKGNT